MEQQSAEDPHPWAWRCASVLMKTGESRRRRKTLTCAPIASNNQILTDCVSIHQCQRQSAGFLHAVFVYFYRMVNCADKKHKLLGIVSIQPSPLWIIGARGLLVLRDHEALLREASLCARRVFVRGQTRLNALNMNAIVMSSAVWVYFDSLNRSDRRDAWV